MAIKGGNDHSSIQPLTFTVILKQKARLLPRINYRHLHRRHRRGKSESNHDDNKT